jgi:hypothetical protein
VVKPVSAHTVAYCVSEYAPNSPVAVRDERTGRTVTIRTNNRGSGCTQLPVAPSCGRAAHRPIVATGTGADGNPATSQADAVAPAGRVGCVSSGEGVRAGRIQPLSGTGAALLAAVGGVIVGLGVGAVAVWRRRAQHTSG